MIKLSFFLFCICSSLSSHADVKILYTSALIPYKFEERKEEYIKCLQILDSFGYKDKTYIAESGPYNSFSFFDKYCDHVLYANTNDITLRNKGVNEVKATLAAFKYFNFDENDMLMKLTGRYFFNNDHFLSLVENNPDVDAWFAPRYPGKQHAFRPEIGRFPCGITTGCMAIRAKYYKKMLEEMNLEEMERHYIDVEIVVEHFANKMIQEGAKVVFLEKIGLTANIANLELFTWE